MSERKSLKEKNFDFDSIWDVLPHASAYQFLLLGLGAVNSGFLGGTMIMYPVFAQLEPPFTCSNSNIDPCSSNCSHVVFDRSIR